MSMDDVTPPPISDDVSQVADEATQQIDGAAENVSNAADGLTNMVRAGYSKPSKSSTILSAELITF
jgi:hypothetical protein